MLPLESVPMPMLNIEGADFLDRTDELLGRDHKWETHVAQVPLPRTSSLCPSNNQTGSLAHLEPETEDDMDIRDFPKDLPTTLDLPSCPGNPK